METFSALLAICAGNSPVPGEFPAQRPVTRSFDVFFDLRLNKRLSKQSWGWWFETLSPPLWCHRNVPASFCAKVCVIYVIMQYSNRLFSHLLIAVLNNSMYAFVCFASYKWSLTRSHRVIFHKIFFDVYIQWLKYIWYATLLSFLREVNSIKLIGAGPDKLVVMTKIWLRRCKSSK